MQKMGLKILFVIIAKEGLQMIHYLYAMVFGLYLGNHMS